MKMKGGREQAGAGLAWPGLAGIVRSCRIGGGRDCLVASGQSVG